MLEAPPEKKKAAGAPLWLATFADLMSLLMCFFVLILSFSEMDVFMWKRIAGSMAEAFGADRELHNPIPMGTSFVSRTFSPGKPDPTVVTLQLQMVKDFRDLNMGSMRQANMARAVAARLKNALTTEQAGGMVSIIRREGEVVIRIQEKGSFTSGSARLLNDIEPLLAKVADVVVDLSGQVVVEGHTDDRPIRTERFRSNWELSTARAVTVLHQLLENPALKPEQFLIRGHADTQPLEANDTPEGRALNRRVEIKIKLDDGEA